jgi:hypothetical protein
VFNCDACVLIKKKISYVLYTVNTLTCFERFFLYKKILEVLKMCFCMDFLITKKKFYFLTFLDFTTCL